MSLSISVYANKVSNKLKILFLRSVRRISSQDLDIIFDGHDNDDIISELCSFIFKIDAEENKVSVPLYI